MNGRKASLSLACLAVATTIGVLTPSTAQAAPTTGVLAAGSYGWQYALVIAAVLLGFLVVGLWGDVVIGALIVGICAAAVGAASIAGKAYSGVRLNVRRPGVGSVLASQADAPEEPDAGTTARRHLPV